MTDVLDNPLMAIEQYIVNYVHKLRLEKKLSQKEIGDILGVDQSFIAKVEKVSDPAKYNVNHINMLAVHFRISPKDFMPSKGFLNRTAKKSA